MIPSISWKNIWRNRVRSLVVIAAMTLGLFGGLFCSAFFEGMADRRVNEALTKEISHIQIHHKKYLENPEIQFSIGSIDEKMSFIESLPQVKAASARLKMNAMIASSSTTTGVTIMGINPEKEMQVSELYTALIGPEEIEKQYGISDPALIQQFIADSVGAYFQQVSRNPIFIGEEMAKKLKIKVRSKLVLTFQDTEGGLTGAAFRVCGIFRTENSLFEETAVFVRQQDIEALVGLPPQTAHEIAIFLHEDEAVESVTNTLSEAFENLEVSDWKTIQPDIAMLNDMMAVSMVIIMVIVMLALGFGIVNTMLMVVLERVKEIGMLMAVGMNKTRVFFMIILESVLLCLTGAALGMGISVLVIETLRIHGLDLTGTSQQGFEAMGFGAVFYPSLSVDFYALVTLLVIMTGVLASVYPAWKALRLNPADALRTE